jgi:hypothetical protein
MRHGGGERRGVLPGIDRDLGRNLRIRAGRDFTDFGDDLADFDYDLEHQRLNPVRWHRSGRRRPCSAAEAGDRHEQRTGAR